ncbi:MAG TPA: aspartate kinase, partial [Candidatus Glassbacteria bacterium]|nr:aspartate kinase [Candidatus Glassbacteria bacterium]
MRDSIVCKFGGTSLADAGQIGKAQRIIRSDARRRFVVPSAPGKRDREDTKITDLLYLCHEMARQKLDFSGPYRRIRMRYLKLAEELRVGLDMAGLLDRLHRDIEAGVSRDFVASRG